MFKGWNKASGRSGGEGIPAATREQAGHGAHLRGRGCFLLTQSAKNTGTKTLQSFDEPGTSGASAMGDASTTRTLTSSNTLEK
jgi:hypothetical protein